MNKQTLLAISVTLIVAAMLFAPLADTSEATSGATANGVNITTFDETKNVGAGDSVKVEFALINTGSDPVYVNVASSSSSEKISVSFDEDSPLIGTGSDNYTTITATVTTDRYESENGETVTFSFVVVKAGVPDATCSIAVTLNVSSVYSDRAAYNSILGIFSNPLPAPFDTAITAAFLTLLIWIGLSVFVAYVFMRFILRLIFRKNAEERGEVNKQVGKLFFWIVMLYGISNCLDVIGMDPVYVAMFRSISDIVYIFLGALIAWGVYKSAVKFMLSNIIKTTDIEGIDYSLIPLFRMIGKIIIVIVAFASILAVLGFDLMAIIAGAGIAGLALSLGAQSTLNQFFSGLTLLITRPFKAGDLIRLNTDTDILRVRKVGLMNTVFENWANKEKFTMPNDSVVNATIVNMTGEGEQYRVTVLTGVSYSADLDLAKKLMLEVAYEHPHVIKDGSFDKPATRLMSFDDSQITLRLAVYVDSFEDHGIYGGELREGIIRKFKMYNVEIPFPQMDVHVDMTEKKE